MKNKKNSPIQPDTLVVRFPEGLKEQIMSHAKDANRSANAHIIYLLQSAISESTPESKSETSEKAKRQSNRNLEHRLVALENTVNRLAEDFSRILEKLDDQV